MPRDSFNFSGLDRYVTRLAEISEGSEAALFYREKNSYKGISSLKKLKYLKARQVNQGFLDEICDIENLELLSLSIISVHDLSPLLRLKKLRVLRLQAVHRVQDFSHLSSHAGLEGLYIEHARNLTTLDFLSDSTKLTRLGVEGSMYTPQKIATLRPLSKLRSLEALFLTSVQLADKRLDYLSACKALVELTCARFAPKENFEELSRLMPGLKCQWFDKYEV